jgi:Fe2+ or Zn2+ uptake regulation protein
VDTGGSPTRYDPITQEGHHNFVGLKCGDLRDVHPQGLHALELPWSDLFGYRIINRELLFQGYCRDSGFASSLEPPAVARLAQVDLKFPRVALGGR